MFAGTIAGRFRSLGSFGNIQFVSYTVQSGDTLNAIADHFGVDMNTIAMQNNITDPNVISAGQQLDIPMEDAQFNAYYASIANTSPEFTPAQIAAAGSTSNIPQTSGAPAVVPTPKSLQAQQSAGFFQGATFGINNVLFYGSIAAIIIFVVIPYLRKPAVPKVAHNEPHEGDGHGDDI
jgi:LysM repeat protein